MLHYCANLSSVSSDIQHQPQDLFISYLMLRKEELPIMTPSAWNTLNTISNRMTSTREACIHWHWRGRMSFPFKPTPKSEPLLADSPHQQCNHRYCNNGTGQYVGMTKCSNNFPEYGGIIDVHYSKDLSLHWQCGGFSYMYLPIKWNGCSVLLNHTISNVKIIVTKICPHRLKRDMATFTILESYHWHIVYQ